MSDWIRDRYRELRGTRTEADVDEEIAHHLAERVRENLAAGMSEADARAEAARRFGDAARIRRETLHVDRSLAQRRRLRDTIGIAAEEWWHAVRGLVRRPGVAVFVLATLTLGMGAAAAVFTVVDRVVLRPLAYPDASELVWIHSGVPYVGEGAHWGVSAAGYHLFRDETRTLAAVGAYATGSLTFGAPDGPVRVRAAAVTASLLTTLAIRPHAGRLLVAADDVPGGPNVVLLGHQFWQQQLGGDPAIVGRTVQFNGVPWEVVGILPPGVHLPGAPVDVWRPLRLDPAAPPVNAHWLQVVGRRAAGAPREAVAAELARLTATFTTRFPGAYSAAFMRESGFTTDVLSLKDQVLGDVARTLWILFGSVLLLLAIAVANVATLFLVRAEGRRRELAIRVAVGAGRGRLAWLHLAEGLSLALAAAGPALLLAWGGVRGVLALAPDGLPRLNEIALGGGTIAFTLSLTLLAGVVLGVLPLLFRLVDFRALRESARGLTASPARQRARRVMVAGQVALAVVLLAASGLMLRSFARLRAVAPGFDAAHLTTFTVPLGFAAYQGYEAVAAFHRTFQERLRALPGVTHAAATTHLPLVSGGGCAAIFIEDRPDDGTTQPCVPAALAGPGFFEAMRIPVRGMAPTWADLDAGTGAVVVTAALARRLWPGQDPIGKGIRGNGWARPFYRVTGVADDIRSEGLDRPPLEAVFFPLRPIDGAPLWSPPNTMTVVVRSARDDAALLGAIRALLRELDAAVPLVNAQTMEAAIARSPSVARTTLTLALLGVAGAMALLLSAVGMYGVIAHLVAQRTGEMGLRLALGARPGQVVALVLRQSLALAVTGVLAGTGAALLLTRSLRALLFEVSPSDPLVLALSGSMLLGIAAVAALVPALRAARVDPREALAGD